MTKAIIAAAAKANGLTSAYSGKKRKMYLKGKGARRVASTLRAQFPDLHFTLADQTN
jgi:hypothetical protein